MRMQRTLTAGGFALALTTLATAQSGEATPTATPGVQTAHPKALGDAVRGPLDVMTAPFDNRCLGVEVAFGYIWVTGRGDTTIGDDRQIHQYDMAGNFLGNTPQVTNSTAWGGRDMEADDAAGKLWIGSDNGELAEYDFDPAGGPNGSLTFNQFYNFGAVGTVRALARNPVTGNFYSGDFSNVLREFQLPSTQLQTWTNPGISIYGAGFNPCDGTVWWWSQNADPSAPLSGHAATQWDPLTGLTTGVGFQGLDVDPGATMFAGGADVYEDPLNPGNMSLMGLHQHNGTLTTEEDVAVGYDLATPSCGCSSVVYCTPKVNSQGCTPNIFSDAGCPSASGGPWNLHVDMLLNNKPGMIFHGTQRFNLPFQGGFLCVLPPVNRTPPQSTGGNPPPNDCSGTMILDVVALGFAAGTTVNFQAWSRDPGSPVPTNLSAGIEFTIQP